MKKNVASQIIGAQMTTASDGSNFTGAVTVYVTGDGGTQAVGSVGSGACTHEGKGFHTYAPAQAETNYDHVAFTFEGSGAITVTIQIYPSFPQTGDNFARLGAPAGASVSADIAAAKVDTAATKAKTDQLAFTTANQVDARVLTNSDKTGYALSSAGVQAIWDALTSALTTAGSIGKLLVDNINATISSRSSHAAADVWSVATRLLTAGTNIVLAKGTGVTGFNDLSAAQVNAEADQALADYDAPTRAELTSDTDSILSKLLKYFQLTLRKDAAIGTDNSTELTAINADGGSGAGAYSNQTDGQEAIRDALPTAASIADQVWDESIAGHVGAGSTGEALNGATAPSAAVVADAVWDEALSGHLGAGSTGEALNAAGAAGDPWTTQLPGAYGAGSAGKIIGDNVNATISSRASQTSVDDLPTNAELATALAAADDAVLAAIAALNNLSEAGVRSAIGLAAGNLDTQIGDLPTNAELATALGTADDAVLAQMALVRAKTDNLPTDPADQSLIIAATDAITSAIAALNNLSAAQVRTELSTELGRIDAAISTRATPAQILTTALTEAYAAAGAAPTLSQLLFLLHALFTEASAVGTTLTAKKLDGATTAATFTLDDATNPTSIERAS